MQQELRYILILIFCALWSSSLHSQEIEVRGYLGATYYMGDLAPLRTALSASEGNVSFAIGLGTKLSNVFKLHSTLTLGKLSGNDANASDSGRQTRNLSFQSPLTELAITTDININHWLKGLDRYGIKLYYKTGLAVFHFQPKAVLRGQIVNLQPLGTEGQNIGKYGSKYSTYQLSIPFGVGLQFALTDRIAMGFEIVPRWTFTDYIDDVSGYYVNQQELLDAGQTTTVELANRTGEFFGTAPINYNTGDKRGDPTNNDWYIFAGLHLSYIINKKAEKPTNLSRDILPPTILDLREHED